ncbi:MAG TPA: tetratricopeptide repeat protein, partial [Devosia sp.]
MSNETIFREVDEELRGDRLRNLWRRFGPYVIGAAVAIVLLVAINEGWSWWQGSQAAAASDKFYAALEIADGTDVAAAQKAFEDVEATSPAGYATLARFREAGLLAKEGKADEAIAAYDSLATSE